MSDSSKTMRTEDLQVRKHADLRLPPRFEVNETVRVPLVDILAPDLRKPDH